MNRTLRENHGADMRNPTISQHQITVSSGHSVHGLAPSAGRVEGGRQGWQRAGVLDDLSSECPEFDVAVLRRRAQDRERLGGGDPPLPHEHADRLVDDRAGGQLGAQLIGEGDMVGQPDGDRQCP